MRELNIEETFEIMNPIITAIFERAHPYVILNDGEIGFSEEYIFNSYRVESVSDNFVIAYDRDMGKFKLYINHYSKGWFIAECNYYLDQVKDFYKSLIEYKGVEQTEIIDKIFTKKVAK